MPLRPIFNPASQVDENALCEVDGNGEIVCSFGDGGFVKFPAGLNGTQWDALIAQHRDANRREPDDA